MLLTFAYLSVLPVFFDGRIIFREGFCGILHRKLELVPVPTSAIFYQVKIVMGSFVLVRFSRKEVKTGSVEPLTAKSALNKRLEEGWGAS